MNMKRLTHEEFVERLPNWNVFTPTDFKILIEELTAHLEGYGRVWMEDDKIKIATGGWSENEEIVAALMQNSLFVALFWESTHRGGLTVIRPPVTANIQERRG